jgi:hypothetical protein
MKFLSLIFVSILHYIMMKGQPKQRASQSAQLCFEAVADILPKWQDYPVSPHAGNHRTRRLAERDLQEPSGRVAPISGHTEKQDHCGETFIPKNGTLFPGT